MTAVLISQIHSSTLAMVRAMTETAPAFSKVRAHSIKVAPEVQTSSMRIICLPATSLVLALNAPFTFLSRCCLPNSCWLKVFLVLDRDLVDVFNFCIAA